MSLELASYNLTGIFIHHVANITTCLFSIHVHGAGVVLTFPWSSPIVMRMKSTVSSNTNTTSNLQSIKRLLSIALIILFFSILHTTACRDILRARSSICGVLARPKYQTGIFCGGSKRSDNTTKGASLAGFTPGFHTAHPAESYGCSRGFSWMDVISVQCLTQGKAKAFDVDNGEPMYETMRRNRKMIIVSVRSLVG